VGKSLALAERATLEDIVNQAEPTYVRRARVLLDWDDGLALAAISERAGLSVRRVRYWLRQFMERRLRIFPDKLLAVVVPPESPESEDRQAASTPQGTAGKERLTIQELCERYHVDLDDARHVAALALQLYDLSQDIHGLSAEWRPLLETAALVRKVGLSTRRRGHHRVAYDILLRYDLDGHSAEQRDILACTALLHRKKAQPQECPAFVALSADAQRVALVLAALLRMADGLGCTKAQSPKIQEVRPSDGTIRLVIGGPGAQKAVARARSRADLWRALFGASIQFVPVTFALVGLSPLGTDHAERMERRKTPGVTSDDPMSEAGRKVLRFHFLQMLDHEPGTRAGDDTEELHDMRVATRRMRAAFRVFGSHFERKAIAPFLKGLRRTANMLGSVRDLDVFMEKATKYLEMLPEGEEASLDPLLASWRLQREEARQRMLTYLDGDHYQEFCERFAVFLQTRGAGSLPDSKEEPSPSLVAHVAPGAIYQRLAQVRAFDPFLADAPMNTLHALRIHCKHLRYTLEFFQEVLGPEAEDVIAEVVAMQDHLGTLQDAVIASDILRGFLNDWARRQRTERMSQRVDVHGVARYLAAKQAEVYNLLESFPAAWQHLNAPELRRCLALAVAVL